MNNREDALDLIRKLFNLGDKEKNNSDQEAELSILKAQKLMAKYDISIEEVKKEKEPEYAHEICEHKWNYGYRVPLAQVLAKNFRCELYERGKSIVFMGRKVDAAICGQTFEFAYKYIRETDKSPFEKALEEMGIEHILIPPRTPWHNGKVERSHRNDQRYFYNWETFRSVDELNEKLKKHLIWSNNKTMRTLGRKSPIQILKEKLAA